MSVHSDPTRRAFIRALAAEGALSGLLWGCAASAFAVLALRALSLHAPGWTPAVLAAIPIASFAGALLALRRLPSRGACAALTEDATHAGGLLLVEGMPGADAWKRPEPVAAKVSVSLRPRLFALIPALAALVAAFMVPKGWFAAAEAPVPKVFPDITADIRNEIEELREEETTNCQDPAG